MQGPCQIHILTYMAHILLRRSVQISYQNNIGIYIVKEISCNCYAIVFIDKMKRTPCTLKTFSYNKDTAR
jgi:hypothetical protein